MLNKREFIDRAKEIARQYAGTRRAFLLDVDFVEFKLINYYYSIQKGTELLTAFERFLQSLPETAVSMRVVSDRFAALFILEHPAADEEILSRWNGYADRFVAEHKDGWPAYNMKLRCGIAAVEHEDLVRDMNNAAISRTAASPAFGNATMLFNEAMLERINLHNRAEIETNRALREKRFIYYLQPKVDLRTGKIVGAEALARRIGPDGAVLYPDSFIPVMEETGSVVELDFLILELVCADLAKRRASGRKVVPVSVNFSRFHSEYPDARERIGRIVEKYQIPAGWLSFELTETIFLEDYTEIKRLVDGLRADGFRVAIDDYGSGYNSVIIWEKLNFDTLKLDHMLLSNDAGERKRNDLIAEDMTHLAGRFGCRVICEGAETAEDCRRALRWGVRYAQGRYFHEAMAAEEFYRLLDEMGEGFDVSSLAGPGDDREQIRRLSDQLTIVEILLECLQVLAREEDYNVAFHGFLERLGRYYRADRAYIFEFDAKEQTADNTYEWCSPGVTEEKETLQHVPLKTMERWIRLFESKGEVYINALDEEVDRNSQEYRILESQGIKSVLVAPLHANGVLVGFLGVDNPTRHQDDLTLLRASTDFITEEIRKRDTLHRLKYASYIDMLTGLFNRNCYLEALAGYESQPPRTFGVIFADVNGMKAANDRYGHEYGDEILKKVARTLKKAYGGSAYRIGGDEFVLLFENMNEKDFQSRVALLRQEMEAAGGCNVSFGHAWRTGAYTTEEVIGEADQSMYLDKESWYQKHPDERRQER